MEGWRVRKDGTRFWANVVIDPVRDEDGTLLGFAKITRDISERRALEQAREQLHQAQKMETVGQLTGGVAHDFNNLLTAVNNSLHLIGQLTSDGRIQRLVNTAVRAVERGAKLTSQLLAFSRKQTLKPQMSDLNELISVFDALLRRAVGDAVQIELDLQRQACLAEVDQAQFQSALLNLIVNARDAMSDSTGGKITVSTRDLTIDETRAAELGEIAPGDYFEITVADTGTGMPPDVAAKAIEPFYTTKEVGKGSGLGLSQVYGFVRQSGGQMEIKSEVGRGTAVRLYLPCSHGIRADEPMSGNRPTERKTPSVLVVEDDAELLDITIEMLKAFGYEVHTASNAPEALNVLDQDVPIDVLFTDIVMPKGMDGVALAREVRRRHPGIRVLLTSGYARDVLRNHRPDTDMEFISKPYRMPELADRLRTMMQDRLRDC
jgi:signal transduction histidine kinase/CheY-like chemotaxis protein